MKRWADLAIITLLALALVRGINMAREAPTGPPAAIPLLESDTPAGALSAPGATHEIVANQLAVVGDVWTIEDLARAAQLMESGALADVPPLSEKASKEVKKGLRAASQSRTELTKIQTDIQDTEKQLNALARELLESLTPDQRTWIVNNRDRISVSEVEQRYWDALLTPEAQ